MPLDIIDRMIEADLSSPQAQPPEPPATPPERIDRVISFAPQQEITLLQIDSQFQSDWLEAMGDLSKEAIARQTKQDAKQKLREEMILPYAMTDLVLNGSLVYGAMFPMVAALGFPDGRCYTVEALIHFSHPVSPEDLYLREKRVTAKRIYRYRVPGLDDSEWLRQNEPRDTLDCIGWRALVLERFRNGASS